MIRLLRQWLVMMRKDPLADRLARDAAASKPEFFSGLHDKTMRSIRVKTPLLRTLDCRTRVPGPSRESVARSAASHWSAAAIAVCLLLVVILSASWNSPRTVSSPAGSPTTSVQNVIESATDPEANRMEAYDATLGEMVYLIGVLDGETWLEREQDIQLAMDDVLDWFLDSGPDTVIE